MTSRASRRAGKIIKLGIPSGRRGDELNRGIAPWEDARHDLRGPINYEWWYFDATFDNGYSAVAIMWPMNYAKPYRRQCTVQLSIYPPDGECVRHYVFPPRRVFSASRDTCDVRAGESYARGSHPSWEVHVEVAGDAVDLLFEAETPGWKPGDAVNVLPFPRYNSMGWLVPVPRARASGTITLAGKSIEVSGHGYHDHNWGEAPIYHFVDNWHWGHLVCGDVGITWADITMAKSLAYDHVPMLLLSRGGRLVAESAEMEVRREDWRSSGEYLHPYPGRVAVSFGTGDGEARGSFAMSVERVVETQDLLEMTDLPAFVRRAVNATIARPYYFRWRSSVLGWVELDGERLELAGETIHEQMLFRGRHPSEESGLRAARARR